MTQDKYFREELTYLREQGKMFSESFPQLSRFLQSKSCDPDVERLLEGFAFLTSRLRAKVDDEIPELTHSMLNMLWPNYLRPVPSLTIMAFSPDESLTHKQVIPSGSLLDSRPVDGTICHFSSCRDVNLYPIHNSRVYSEHTREASTISIQLESVNQTALASMNIEGLRFYLGGDKYSSQMLYLWLNHYLDYISISIGERTVPITQKSISRVGFDKNDALLPYPQNVSDGYRLLQEYLTFPEAFSFIDVEGIQSGLNEDEHAQECRLCFHFNKTLPSDVAVTTEHFQLHCTPAINLFAHDSDPIDLTGKQTEYLVSPSSRLPSHYEIFCIDNVVGWQDTAQKGQRMRGKKRTYAAFESFHHEVERVRNRQALYYRSRIKNSVRGDGFDTFISFVRGDETVSINVAIRTCRK